jgi:hypothetical protein
MSDALVHCPTLNRTAPHPIRSGTPIARNTCDISRLRE